MTCYLAVAGPARLIMHPHAVHNNVGRTSKLASALPPARAEQNPVSQSAAFALVFSPAEPPGEPSPDPYNPPRTPPFRYPAAPNPRAAHLARLAQCMYPHRQNEGDANPSQYSSGQHAYGGAYNATQHTQQPLPPMRPMSAPGFHPSSMASQQQYAYAVPPSGYQYDSPTYSGAPPSYAHWQAAGYAQPAPSLSQQASSLSHGSGGQRPNSLSMYATGGGSRGSQPSSPHVPSPLSGATRARPQAADAAGSSQSSRRPPVDLTRMNSSYRSIIAAVSHPDMGIVDPTLRHQRADRLQQAHHDAMHTLGHLDSTRAHSHIRDRHNSVHGAPATARARTMSSGDLSRRPTKLDNPGGEQRKCLGCDATATPEWRRGPKGPGTLCNACGLVYAKLLKTRMNEGGHGSALADTDAAPSSSRRRLSGSGHTGSTGGEGSDHSDVAPKKSHKY